MSDSHVCRVPVFIVVSVMSLIWFSPGHTELFRPGGTGKDAATGTMASVVVCCGYHCVV